MREINKFEPSSVTYITDMENMRQDLNDLEAKLIELRGAYTTVAERLSLYPTVDEIPALVSEVKTLPVDITKIQVRMFNTVGVPSGTYLDYTLNAVTVRLNTLTYPDTATSAYINITDSGISLVSTALFEAVLDTSALPDTSMSFLYNNAGVLSTRKEIPISDIYQTPTFSGLPAGVIIPWNNNDPAVDVATFYPVAAPWALPSPSSANRPFLFPNGNCPANTNLLTGLTTISMPYTSFNGGLLENKSRSGTGKSVNWITHDGSTVQMLVSNYATAANSPSYLTSTMVWGDYYGKRCFFIQPYTQSQFFFPPAWNISYGGASGMMFEFSIRHTQTAFTFPNGTFSNYSVLPLYVMSYESYGTNVLGVYYSISTTDGVTPIFTVNISGMYCSIPTLTITAAEFTSWTKYTVLTQDGKWKLFKNNIEVSSGTTTGTIPDSRVSKIIGLSNNYYYSWETDMQSRYYNQVYIADIVFTQNFKDIYMIDWNSTNNSLFKTKERFTGLELNRDWVVFKGQYPELFSVIGSTYNTAADNADGTVFRIPFDLRNKIIRMPNAGTTVNSNTARRTNGDAIGSMLNDPLIQSHAHTITAAAAVKTAGAVTYALPYSTATADVTPIVTGSGSVINTASTMNLSDMVIAGASSDAPNMSERYFILTGK